MLVIYLSFGAVAGALLAFLYALGTSRQRKALLFGLCSAIAIGLLLTFSPILPDEQPGQPIDLTAPDAPGGPIASPVLLPSHNIDEGFVSSEACKECHAEQFSSWHKTFHRTMTQEASPQSVVPSFDNVNLHSRGRDYHLTRRDGEFWVDTVSPTAELAAFARNGGDVAPATLPREMRQIVMTTGSHLHQTYWMQNPNGTLIQFPWVYHIKSHRWVYRIDSFLRPPSETVTFNIWNMTCIACHSTGGEPRVDATTRTMHSKGELGISCEACHGPGEQHVAEARLGKGKNDPLQVKMAHPGKLDAVASSKICGQCHVIAGRTDEAEFYAHGDPYTAGGDNFEQLRQVTREMEDVEFDQPHFASSVKTAFWPDGTVRTGGREYNGLIRSPCYTDGAGDRQMSCISCHSMHEFESPNKLMAKNKTGDRQCTQCHSEPQYTSDLTQHTHHNLGSDGSRCVNCHMPHTSYALFSAIRSHRIQSPQVRASQRGGRPNACNLCHLNETKAWAADRLSDWYDIEAREFEGDEVEIAAGALWALKGDAAQRAVAAWHFGWSPAKATFGPSWTLPILGDLLVDKYAAVRYMAVESLRTWDAFRDIKYDFDGTAKHRGNVRDDVLRQWKETTNVDDTPTNLKQILLKQNKQRAGELVQRLLSEQDQRPISIVE